MSFSKYFSRSTLSSFIRLRESNDDLNNSVDLTSSDADRQKCMKEIRHGNVSKLKIFTDDIAVISENSSSLASSVTELLIRPLSDEELSDKEGDEGGLASRINEIPLEIKQFSKLISFSLDNNGKHPLQLMNVISCLLDLQLLTLQNCGIKEFPEATLSENLASVDLGHNHLKEIPSAIYKLRNLQSLILTQNELVLVSDKLALLGALTKLDLSQNKISQLPVEVFNLKSLTKLYLSGNKIELLPEQICNLTKLKHLDLNSNCLKSLPDSIGELFNLRLLTLTYNNLTSLPESICNLNVNDDALLLGGNPLHKPPIEVCTQGKAAIKGYFDASKKSLSVNCKRVKMVLLGETLAGKTSLAKALVEGRDANVKAEERTVGLDYYFWRPRPHEDGPELEILIVDCAGQRKYLLTHQFFFTEGAIFVLVVDLEQYSQRGCDYISLIDDWINVVNGQVPGAVIQIVPTHLDKFKDLEIAKRLCDDIITKIQKDEEARIRELDSEIEKMKAKGDSLECLQNFMYLRRKRPHLPKYCILQEVEQSGPTAQDDVLKLIPVSCKGNLEGLLELKKEILRMVDNKNLCPIVDREVPESWIHFEKKIKSLKSSQGMPIITVDDLFKISEEEEFCFTRQMFSAALIYLNAIGSLAHFENVQQAKHLVFLDPNWLINLLQLIFRHDHETNLHYEESFSQRFHIMEDKFNQDKDLLLENGILSKSLLRCIWENIEDKENLIQHLVNILDHFSIICKLPNSSNCPADEILYFITWFLGEEMPSNALEAWEEFNPETDECLITRVDVAICVLPSSIFERFLIYVQKETDICAPWKSGFFAKNGKCKILCKVANGKNSSSVQLHGRFSKGHVREMWLITLKLWKQFQVLVDEWSGLTCRQSYSICPNCVAKGKENPKLFSVNWFEKRQSGCTTLKCHKCLHLVDAVFVMPCQDIVRSLDEKNKTQGPFITGPLTSLELSKVAEMIGNGHHKLALSLGLEEFDIEAAKDNWPHNLYEQVMELLKKWKRNHHGEAEREVLVEALKELQPLRGDIISFLNTGSI